MDQRQEMMDDAIDDVTGLEDEEEGEEVVNQVLDEIGVDLNQAVSIFSCCVTYNNAATKRVRWARRRQACKRTPWQKAELLRQLVALAERKTMTFRREWTTFDGDRGSIKKGLWLQRGRSELGHSAAVRCFYKDYLCYLWNAY